MRVEELYERLELPISPDELRMADRHASILPDVPPYHSTASPTSS